MSVGHCRYVYAREDAYFTGVSNPHELRARLLEWHEKLAAGVERFNPRTRSQHMDWATMRHLVSLFRDLVDRGCDIELARWTSERG
ncbi:Hypothetical protein A7982_04267 [Minicystis rosea]|nr:Hypothetical protein A7982_04267 [Minicystis rosea]